MQVIFRITHSSCWAERDLEVAVRDEEKTCSETTVDPGLGSEAGKRWAESRDTFY